MPPQVTAPDPADPRALRDAFGCFATGVTVVTAHGPDGPQAFTANSFTSVSLHPPLLLVCPALSASSLPSLRAAGAFAVNVLARDQEAFAKRAATRGADRFDGEGWNHDGPAPTLAGACAVFECDLETELPGGDHAILLGRVRRFRTDRAREPLLWFHGRYGGVHAGD